MLKRLFGSKPSSKDNPPVTSDERKLLQWVEGQIESGVPRQVISMRLMALDSHKMTLQELTVNMAVIGAVESLMFRRNEQGIVLEKQGRSDEAVSLYEENISDLFEGKFPYDRLRIIYTKQKDYGRAIRACQEYIQMIGVIVGAEEKSHGDPRNEMLAHIEKLSKRQATVRTEK